MYLNIASVDDLDHFRDTASWPVSEDEKEILFGAVGAACTDLLIGETRHFQQQILRGILPTVAHGCMNASYSAIVLARLQSAGSKFSNYKPSHVDYLSWLMLKTDPPREPFVMRFVAPYLGWKSWLRHGVKRLGHREDPAAVITTNPSLEEFLKSEQLEVYRSHFVEWFLPLRMYSKKQVAGNFAQRLSDRLWAAVEPFGPGQRVRGWLLYMIKENVDAAAAMLLASFRSRRARVTRVLYAPTQGHPGNRLAALAVLENGGTVVGFPHSGGLLIDFPMAWMLEGLTTSCFYCYTQAEQWFRKRQVPTGLEPVSEFRLLPQADHGYANREHSGKIRNVMYLCRGYLGDRTYVGVLPEVISFDLEMRIIDALVREGLKVTVKLHRKSRSVGNQRGLLEERYGDRISLEDRPLTALLREGLEVDAFVVENVKAGSLIEVMKTDRPVILFSSLMHFLLPETEDTFFGRVKVIPCSYDSRNRVFFDEEELREYLNRDRRILRYEVVERFTNARFPY